MTAFRALKLLLLYQLTDETDGIIRSAKDAPARALLGSTLSC